MGLHSLNGLINKGYEVSLNTSLRIPLPYLLKYNERCEGRAAPFILC